MSRGNIWRSRDLRIEADDDHPGFVVVTAPCGQSRRFQLVSVRDIAHRLLMASIEAERRVRLKQYQAAKPKGVDMREALRENG